MNKNKSKLLKLSYERRQGLVGYLFLLPWLIGAAIFFVYPFFHTVWLSFCDVSFDAGKIIAKFSGFGAYKFVFIQNKFITETLTYLGTTLLHTVCVLIISIFLAIILNQNFFGRTAWRVIFSLPIIVASGLVLQVFESDLAFQASVGSEASTGIFQNQALTEMLISMGFGEKIITLVVETVNSVVDILWMSGVQILLFITGLQSISPMLYEVCDVEGATAWQKFWKVTFPLLTPYIFLNIIYSIIDIATKSSQVMASITWYYNNVQYANSSAASTGYFLMILIILGAVTLALNKHIVYIDK